MLVQILKSDVALFLGEFQEFTDLFLKKFLGFDRVAFLAKGAGFLAAAFLAGAFLTTGAGLERGFLATFLAGSGFLTAAFGAGLVGLASLSAGFFAGAFLTAGVGLTDFPEGFRDGEGLDFFFNVAQLVPKSRARKVR